MHILEPQRLEHRRQWRGRSVRSRKDRRSILEQAAELHDVELRLKLLSEEDRDFILLVLTHGLKRQQIAAAMGMGKAMVYRRLRRIMNQLHDPMVTMLIDPACTLAPDYKALAILYFIHRIPMAAIAQRNRVTLYDVRVGLEYVRGWFRGVASLQR